MLQHQVGLEEEIGRIAPTEGILGRAASTGRPVLVEGVSGGPDSLGTIGGVNSEICVPVFDGGEAVGFLSAQSVDGVKLTQNDMRVLVAVCELVGVAVGRARLYARAPQRGTLPCPYPELLGPRHADGGNRHRSLPEPRHSVDARLLLGGSHREERFSTTCTPTTCRG